ncbi:flagellar hook-associated protein FlgK [Lysobacter korlensis]|uniref:Flagellar hook-associated protein 1 n=1 Tax=Lysobacter korlensis TaxID=553636 RepID=A0ABV6RVR3_9GAMM
MSTFGGLNTAYSGLTAARRGMEVVGQNITNATTAGYTRQRIETSAVAAPGSVSMFRTGVEPGAGVSVDAINRLSNEMLNGRVRTTAAETGYWGVRSTVLGRLETALREPSDAGLSSTLQDFWAGWQDVSNRPGDFAAGGVLLERSSLLASHIAQGYADATAEWSGMRSQTQAIAADVNSLATDVAELNAQIRQALASGSSANELLDQRDLKATQLAALTGAAVRPRDDGTVDIVLGGDALVSSGRAREVVITGALRLEDAGGAPVQLEWADRPGVAVTVDGGELLGALSVLAPADGTGKGGAIAEAAAAYNALATSLHDQVNAVHTTGVTGGGVAGGDFFELAAGVPAALGLRVVPTDATQIAAGGTAAGEGKGSTADKISQLGTKDGGPDDVWSSYVVRIGVESRATGQQLELADRAARAASTQQLAQSSVDLDEETTLLLTYQHAYQGAARVMTAIDEMLDTLINRTGVVGR